MSHIYIIPGWFFSIDVFLEFAFAFTSALIALYALKIYNIAEQREMRLLGSGFLFISASYIIKGLIDLFILQENMEGIQVLELEKLNSLGLTGIYIQFILFIAGLVTLAYLTFGIRSKRAYTLLLVTNLTVLAFSNNMTLAYYLLSTILIAYIIVHYLLVYSQKKNPLTLMVLLGFLALFLSEIGLIFTNKYYVNYVYSHGLEFAAYALFLISLGLTIRKHYEKKNKT